MIELSTMQAIESNRQRNLIDKLRQHGVDKYVDLPQIAVMGDTSSGKSSVLSGKNKQKKNTFHIL